MNGAWEEWEKLSSRHMLDARARAAFLNSVIIHRAKTAFTDDPYVTFTQAQGSFFLHFGTEIKVRFKKLKPNGTYSNIMTRQQLRLMYQKNIPGILPGTYLTVGYILDKLQQEIQQHKITLQNRKTVIYAIDLDEAASSATPRTRVAPMPLTPAVPVHRRAKARKEVAARKQISS